MFFLTITFQNCVPDYNGTSSNFAKKMQLSGTLPNLFAQPFSSIIKCIPKKEEKKRKPTLILPVADFIEFLFK